MITNCDDRQNYNISKLSFRLRQYLQFLQEVELDVLLESLQVPGAVGGLGDERVAVGLLTGLTVCLLES